MDICDSRMEVGVSMKREGWAEPAQQKSMSGGLLLFHAVTSAIMAGEEDEDVRSADMWWKRWVWWTAEAWLERGSVLGKFRGSLGREANSGM